jgi:hypothetical protein
VPTQLPKRLLLSAGLFSILSFLSSMYLDWFWPDLLQEHPISANLLSAVVGFSTGILVVGYGFNWLSKQEKNSARAQTRERILHAAGTLRTIDVDKSVLGLGSQCQDLVAYIDRFLSDDLIAHIQNLDPKAAQYGLREIREMRETATLLYQAAEDHHRQCINSAVPMSPDSPHFRQVVVTDDLRSASRDLIALAMRTYGAWQRIEAFLLIQEQQVRDQRRVKR